ncbi:MAG: hypothetical protein H0S79_22355 [Anaerolineaceae bacterium]|nr:hypothetical protein [Anaerolineaceae bacterium]
MKQKKTALILVIAAIILSTLACSLPFGSKTDDNAADDSASISVEPTEAPQVENDVVAEETEAVTEAVSAAQVYSDNGIQMTLPSSYIMGDAENDLAILVEGMMAMSEDDADDIQEVYDNNKDDVLFWAYDTNSPATHMTSVVVMKNEEFAGMSLALIAAFSNAIVGEEVDSLSQSQMELNGKDVLRFLTTSENAGVPTAQAIYIFNESGKLWMVGFFTNQEEFDSRLPAFDAAVESFTYTPGE